MRKHQIFLIVTLVCLFAVDGGAATPPVPADPPAEPDTLLDAPKAVPGSAIAPPATAEGTIRGNPLWAIPLSQLSATRERPLFVPSRRAPAPVVANTLRPPPPPPVEKPPEAEPLQLSLVGTVAGESGALGVFLDKAGGAPLRLKIGETHKGWTLRSVGRRDVVLAKGIAMTKLAIVTAEPIKSKGLDAAKGLDPAKVLTPPGQASSQPPAIAKTLGPAGAPKLDPAAFKLAR
jgi:general secretion pathway protein N